MSQKINSSPIDWSCPICLDTLADDKSVMAKRCLHIFHEKCIKTALETKHSCPLCNSFGLNTSELISCDKIKDLYRKIVVKKSSTAEKEILKAFPNAKAHRDGYVAEIDLGEGKKEHLIRPHHILRPLELWGQKEQADLDDEAIEDLVEHLETTIEKTETVINNPNSSEEAKVEAREKYRLADQELDEALEAYKKNYPKRKAWWKEQLTALNEGIKDLKNDLKDDLARCAYEKLLDKKRESLRDICSENDYGSPEYKKADKEIDDIFAEKRRLLDDPSYKPYLNPKTEPSQAPIQGNNSKANPQSTSSSLIKYGLIGIAIAFTLKSFSSFYSWISGLFTSEQVS